MVLTWKEDILEVASMVVSWWIVAFLRSVRWNTCLIWLRVEDTRKDPILYYIYIIVLANIDNKMLEGLITLISIRTYIGIFLSTKDINHNVGRLFYYTANLIV